MNRNMSPMWSSTFPGWVHVHQSLETGGKFHKAAWTRPLDGFQGLESLMIPFPVSMGLDFGHTSGMDKNHTCLIGASDLIGVGCSPLGDVSDSKCSLGRWLRTGSHPAACQQWGMRRRFLWALSVCSSQTPVSDVWKECSLPIK